MKKFLSVFFKIVFSRTMIIFLSILVQAAILVSSFIWLGKYTTFIFSAMTVGGVAVLIYLINKEDLPEFKIAWVIPICLFPVFGTIVFLFVDKNMGSRGLKKEMNKVIENSGQYMKQEESVLQEITDCDSQAGDWRHICQKQVIRHTEAAKIRIFRWVKTNGRICLRRWKERKNLFFWSILS